MFTIIISLLMTYKYLYKHLFIHILLPFMIVYRDMNASIPARFVISICSLSSRADIRSAPCAHDRLLLQSVRGCHCYLVPCHVCQTQSFLINASAVSSCFVYTTSMLWKVSRFPALPFTLYASNTSSR